MQNKVMSNIQIKRLNNDAKLPTHGSEHAAGYDLYSTEKYVLAPGERHLFKTGLTMAIPNGYYGRIAPRSGLAFKNGLDVMAGVIDSDYRGEVGVLMVNLGKDPVELPLVKENKEVPIAQIIFESHLAVQFTEVNEISETERGEGGYGSSDNKKVVGAVPQSTGTIGKSLGELYQKIGGIPIKPRYSDEIKQRDS